MEETFSKSLNSRQLEAVTYCDGPSLVIAGAGSGKTRVLTYKVAYLLEHGYAPYEILALTFTNKAAKELTNRVRDLLPNNSDRLMWCGTFHSVFSRILRIEHAALGFTSTFTIYDQEDSRKLIKSIIKEFGLDDKAYNLATVNSRISFAKNKIILPSDYAQSQDLLKRDARDNMPELHRIYSAYYQRCRNANALDFDDLLLFTYLLLCDHEDICSKYQRLFRYILVDEFQDTNYLQSRILLLLAPSENSRLCVVGDDAQSIYAFRGADIGNILSFQKHYSKARLIKLEQNYRSTQTIVNAANSIISHNKDRIQKNVFSNLSEGERIRVMSSYSDQDESMKVLKEILRLRSLYDIEYSDIAILYRTNAQSRSFESALNQMNIPYKIYGGMSFYQHKEIKDVLAYFRVICNSQDEEALVRIINYPARGIGATTLAKLRYAAAQFQVGLWQVLKTPQDYEVKISTSTQNKILAFVSLIEDLQESLSTIEAYDLASEVIKRSGIAEELHSEKTPEALSRVENVDGLLNAIKEFSQEQLETFGNEHVDLGDYLMQASLSSSQDTVADGGPAVALMTVHAAKGLEFDTVFVTGMEDNLFPNPNARFYPKEMEEERRLFYVAVTRAKTRCFLSYAKSRYRYGAAEMCNPSPFLCDIDSQYLSYDGDDISCVSRVNNRPHVASISSPTVNPASRYSRIENASSHNYSESSIFNVKVGSCIEHERFGRGEIIEISGEGSNARAKVKFENVGEKNLLLKFAKFTQVNG